MIAGDNQDMGALLREEMMDKHAKAIAAAELAYDLATPTGPDASIVGLRRAVAAFLRACDPSEEMLHAIITAERTGRTLGARVESELRVGLKHLADELDGGRT